MCVCVSSEVAGLGSLIQRPQLLKARAPLPERLLPARFPAALCPGPSGAHAPLQPRRAEGAERAGGRPPALCGEHLQRVEGPRVRVLVGIPDDLTQVARQVLAGEGEGAARQLGGARLALRRQPPRRDVPAEAGAGGGGGGGGGGGNGRGQRGGAGGAAEGLWGRGRGRGRGRGLVQQVGVVVVVVGRRRRVVQGSGAAVLHRLGRTRLQGLLKLCHVVGVLDTERNLVSTE